MPHRRIPCQCIPLLPQIRMISLFCNQDVFCKHLRYPCYDNPCWNLIETITTCIALDIYHYNHVPLTVTSLLCPSRVCLHDKPVGLYAFLLNAGLKSAFQYPFSCSLYLCSAYSFLSWNYFPVPYILWQMISSFILNLRTLYKLWRILNQMKLFARQKSPYACL